jgi:two-component system LytT family response regulator
MPAKTRVLIVDDERLSRNIVRKFLEEYDNIEIAGESASGLEALQQIEALRPEIVFLDIQMPDLDVFEVIQETEKIDSPLYIFITAHNKYAVDAFEASAFDYLLKPFSRERFGLAVERALSHLLAFKDSKVNGSIKMLLDKYQELINKDESRSYIQRILIKENKKISLLPLKDVYYMESSGDYVKLWVQNRSYIINESLSNLERQLNPNQFSRIHRSFIINIDHIREFIPHHNGEYFVVMENNEHVKLSRTYKEQFKELIDRKLR